MVVSIIKNNPAITSNTPYAKLKLNIFNLFSEKKYLYTFTSPNSNKIPPVTYEIIDMVVSGLMNKNKPITTNINDNTRDVLKVFLIFFSIMFYLLIKLYHM